MTTRLKAGSAMPEIVLPAVGGGQVKLGGPGRWQLVVVYRGKHCPICNKYLQTLQGLKSDLEATGTEVVAVSGDPREKAEAQVQSLNLSVPVGYGLSLEQMRGLGLYVSNPRSPQETDRPFAEPGTFVVNPDGKLQIIDVSNAPFARPDLDALLRGIVFIQQKDYPIRGTA